MIGTETIRVERRIGAAPSVVYRYLTESELWARWQGASASVDPHPGGAFAMTMPAGVRAEGRFLELQPGRRVVLSWGWRGHPNVPPGSTRVEIDLIPDGDGTLLRLTHLGLPADERPIHAAGWAHYLPRLAAAAEGMDPGPDPGPA